MPISYAHSHVAIFLLYDVPNSSPNIDIIDTLVVTIVTVVMQWLGAE